MASGANPTRKTFPSMIPALEPILDRYRRLPRWGRYSVAGAPVFLIVTLLLASGSGPAMQTGPMAKVERGPLKISIVENGTIRPRQQIILKNETGRAASLLHIVPEGNLVKRGDLLARLDTTALETELTERRIRVQNSEAELIFAEENLAVVRNQAKSDVEQAQLNVQFAKQDLQKFLEGDYPKQLKEIQARITISEEELQRAEQDLQWSERLFEEKYLSQSDLLRDRLAAQRVRLNRDLARGDLRLYEEFTSVRQRDQLTSNVTQTEMTLERATRRASANLAQAEAQLRARQVSLTEERNRLTRAETELSKAELRAPIDGMVLYASSVSQRWRDESRIEEGYTVPNNGEIIYVPTADSFDVEIRIPEVQLAKARVGLPARITVDALPGQSFNGRIASISPLPDSASRFLNPNLKVYTAIVQLAPSAAALRSGMSCQVDVVVEEFDDAIFVPVQAVIREAGRSVVYVSDGRSGRPQPVELGLDNNRMVRIISGLQPGQTILLAPPLDRGGPTPPAALETEFAQQPDLPIPVAAEGGPRARPTAEGAATGGDGAPRIRRAGPGGGDGGDSTPRRVRPDSAP
jgi:HlyD family secretion protein